MKKSKIYLFFLSLCFMFCSCNGAAHESSIPNSQYYEVGDEYFNYEGFKPVDFLPSGSNERIPHIQIEGSCKYDLTQVSANVQLYDDNSLLYSYVQTENDIFEKETKFILRYPVSELVQINTEKAIVKFSGQSSTKPIEDDVVRYTVTFNFNNDSKPETVNVKKGETVSKYYNDPTQYNQVFDYWCDDKELTHRYDFSLPVMNNLNLYAKFRVDYESFTNAITIKVMKCNVTILNKCSNKFLGIETESLTKQGSGIIFHEDSSNYYCLTNNHVTVLHKEFKYRNLTVQDYKGNKYKATLINEVADYDLAVLKFSKPSFKLGVIPMANRNSKEQTAVAAIGQPKGQANAFTFGDVSSYVRGLY